MAAFDLWTHQFCLGCDKQTDDAAYCSESCRLADFEKNSPVLPSSGPGSPVLSAPSCPWTSSRPRSHAGSRSLLVPAYEHFALPAHRSTFSRAESTAAAPLNFRVLTPSSSYSSLCSMQSASTTATTPAAAEFVLLSDKARRELREYAISFDHVRLQRRRSY